MNTMDRGKILPWLVVAAALAAGACSTREVAGTAAGGAAGYEYSNKRAMDQLDADLSAGRITKEEYNKQKAAIEERSVVY